MNKPEKPTLKIVIKSEWFDQIIAKEKTIEHRNISPFWTSRLYDKSGNKRAYDLIEFINGYNTDARRIITEFKGFEKKQGQYHIHIGKIKK
jgi:hypothetical protein